MYEDFGGRASAKLDLEMGLDGYVEGERVQVSCSGTKRTDGMKTWWGVRGEVESVVKRALKLPLPFLGRVLIPIPDHSSETR